MGKWCSTINHFDSIVQQYLRAVSHAMRVLRQNRCELILWRCLSLIAAFKLIAAHIFGAVCITRISPFERNA